MPWSRWTRTRLPSTGRSAGAGLPGDCDVSDDRSGAAFPRTARKRRGNGSFPRADQNRVTAAVHSIGPRPYQGDGPDHMEIRGVRTAADNGRAIPAGGALAGRTKARTKVSPCCCTGQIRSASGASSPFLALEFDLLGQQAMIAGFHPQGFNNTLRIREHRETGAQSFGQDCVVFLLGHKKGIGRERRRPGFQGLLIIGLNAIPHQFGLPPHRRGVRHQQHRIRGLVINQCFESAPSAIKQGQKNSIPENRWPVRNRSRRFAPPGWARVAPRCPDRAAPATSGVARSGKEQFRSRNRIASNKDCRDLWEMGSKRRRDSTVSPKKSGRSGPAISGSGAAEKHRQYRRAAPHHPPDGPYRTYGSGGHQEAIKASRSVSSPSMTSSEYCPRTVGGKTRRRSASADVNRMQGWLASCT